MTDPGNSCALGRRPIIAFSPDALNGRHLRGAGPPPLLVWDAESGREIVEDLLLVSQATFSSVRFMPDGNRLLIATDKGIRFFDATRGTEMDASGSENLASVSPPFPHGHRIASGNMMQ